MTEGQAQPNLSVVQAHHLAAQKQSASKWEATLKHTKKNQTDGTALNKQHTNETVEQIYSGLAGFFFGGFKIDLNVLLEQ